MRQWLRLALSLIIRAQNQGRIARFFDGALNVKQRLADVSGSSGKCYVETTGIEPATSWLQMRRSHKM